MNQKTNITPQQLIDELTKHLNEMKSNIRSGTMPIEIPSSGEIKLLQSIENVYDVANASFDSLQQMIGLNDEK